MGEISEIVALSEWIASANAVDAHITTRPAQAFENQAPLDGVLPVRVECTALA